MPFDLRCPSCQAKLRLDEAPKPRTPIVCPKCDTAFAAPARPAASKAAAEDEDDDPKPAPKKKAGGEDTKAATGVRIESKERVHMNEFKLLAVVGAAMGLFILGLGIILWYLNKAAKVEDMLAMLPSDCNIVRGVNYGQMKKYPGYKAELDKHYTGDVKAAFEEFDKAAGGGGADDWLNYVVIGRQYAAGGENRVLLFNVKKPFDPTAVATALKGKEADESGGKYWLLPATGTSAYTRSGALYFPNDTTVMLFRNPSAGRLAPATQTLLRSAVGYKTDKREDRLHTKFGAAGKLAIRGHIWQLIRPAGGTKDYIGDLAAPVAKDGGLGTVAENGKKSGALGIWVTIGGRGVRLGAALECPDAETASGLVKAMQEGPLGKGDESEVPNGMKQAVPGSGQSEFKEFLQNLSFRSKNEAAYLLSKMETGPEKARPIMELFNRDVLTSSQGAGGAGMPGGPGG